MGGGESGSAHDRVRKTEILIHAMVFFLFSFIATDGFTAGRHGVCMSKFHYIALKNLFGFGLRFLLSSLAISSPSRGKTRHSSFVCI